MSRRPLRYAVIPARYGATRFPGKPLASLAGRALILHVLERVSRAGIFDSVQVATDDERIAAAVTAAGGRAVRTAATHRSGTERVAEAAAEAPPDAWVYNVQGDEPLLPGALLRELVAFAEADTHRELATAVFVDEDASSFTNPNVVKVVVDGASRALYFSRAPIPHGTGAAFLHHIGVYAFRQATLQRFVTLPQSELERREGLEQLRALEHGIPIHVHTTTHRTWGVDTPEDLKAVATRLPAFLESQDVESGTHARRDS